jgi:hypothetical protein
MLDRAASQFVFGLVENTGGRTTHHILSICRRTIRAQIERANLLEAVGLALEVSDMDDHEDVPVAVEWNPDLGAYAYFSGRSGWVTVPEEEMRIYAIRMERFFEIVFANMEFGQRRLPRPLIEDVLWEVGNIRPGQRQRPLPVWFAKRLNVPAVWARVAEMARRRPVSGLRLLLTTTRPERTARLQLPGHLIVSLHDVLDFDNGMAIHPDILAARVDQVPLPDVGAPIWLSPDGRRLIINGDVTVDFRSDIHIAIIRRLVEGYRSGSRYRAQVLLDEAQAGAMTLRKAFGDRIWALLSPYLKSENGLWGFQP